MLCGIMPIYKVKEVINVYCRACGNHMSEKDMICNECKTKAGEGTRYCRACGYHTNIDTEFCSNCGAKQVVTQQTKINKVNLLVKQAKNEKKFMKIEKIISIVGFSFAILFFVIMVARPQPEMNGFVAQPWLSNKVVYGYEVQSYWAESRQLLAYSFMSLLMSICSLISYFVQKSKYKKLLKAIKEAKDVL